MDYQRKPVNIPGWEMYQVDTDGNVYSKSGKILKYSLNPQGYCIVNFYHDGMQKGFAIHTLVAKTFIPNNDPNRNQVNHKNGNKKDNTVTNLEWVTRLENVHHAMYVLGHTKIGAKNPRAKAIQGFDKKTGELKYDFPSISDAARFFVKEGKNYIVIKQLIWATLHQKYGKKSYRGCIWKYK